MQNICGDFTRSTNIPGKWLPTAASLLLHDSFLFQCFHSFFSSLSKQQCIDFNVFFKNLFFHFTVFWPFKRIIFDFIFKIYIYKSKSGFYNLILHLSISLGTFSICYSFNDWQKITYCIEVYGKNYIQFQYKARKDFNDNLYRASKKDNSIILKNTKMDTHTQEQQLKISLVKREMLGCHVVISHLSIL